MSGGLTVSPAARPFFQAGGTLRPDAPCYIKRRADGELAGCLRRGELCYVLTARQCGKSSLLVRTVRMLRREGRHLVLVDLTALGRELTPLEWYRGLLETCGEQLNQEDELEAAWGELAGRGPSARFFGALERVASLNGGLSVCLDEVDYLRSLPFAGDELLAGIRALWNARADRDNAAQVNFCLVGVAAPSDLIRDPLITPFNVGTRIDLTDFTAEEARPLAGGLGGRIGPIGPMGPILNSPSGEAIRVLRRILHWTGGHPFLTQRLCQEVNAAGSRPAARVVDRQVRTLYLAPAARDRDSNLSGVRDQLLYGAADRAALLDLYERVRARGHAAPPADPLTERLLLSGVATTADTLADQTLRLRVRNRIYARVFDRRWVRRHLPDAELQRQAAAYRRGVLRTSLVAAVVIVGFGGLASFALLERARAERSESRLARDLLRSRLTEGTRALQEGDGPAARAAFQAALTLDPANPGIHRMRVAHALDGFPTKIWGRRLPTTIQQAEFSPDGSRLALVGESAWSHETDEARPALGKSRQVGWIVNLRRPGLPPRQIPEARSIEMTRFVEGGRSVVTLSRERDGTRLWDAATLHPGPTLPMAEKVFAFDAPRGYSWIVTADESGAMALWKASGRLLTSIRLPPPPGRPATPRAFVGGSPGGMYLGWSSGAVQRLTFPEHSPPGGAVSSIGSISVGSASEPLTVGLNRVWLSDDGRWLATRSDTHGVTLRRTSRLQLVRELLPDRVEAADFTMGSRFLVTVLPRSIQAWELIDNPEPRTAPETLKQKVILASRVSRRDWILLVLGDGGLRFWNPESGAFHALRLADAIGFARYDPESDRLLAGYLDGRAECLDLRRTVAALALPGPPRARTDPAADGVHTQVAFPIGLVELHRGAPGPTPPLRVDHGRAYEDCLLSPEARRLLTWSHDATRVLWDVPSGRRVARWQPAPLQKQHRTDTQPTRVGPRHAFSPDGRYLAATGPDYAVRIHRAADGALIHTISAPEDDHYRYDDLVWSGHVLAARRETGTVRVWMPVAGRSGMWERVMDQRADAAAITLGRSGRRLAVLSETGVLEIWDPRGGIRPVDTFAQPGRGSVVAFDPEGHRVATACEDGVVRVFDLGQPGQPPTALDHESPADALRFSLDGRLLTTRTRWGRTRVWEVATGALVIGPHGRTIP